MDLLNHDIAHEFPEYLEGMRALKTSSRRFANLFSDYDEDNHAIALYEKGEGVITDDALEALKKKRLKTKDEIYQMLKDERLVQELGRQKDRRLQTGRSAGRASEARPAPSGGRELRAASERGGSIYSRTSATGWLPKSARARYASTRPAASSGELSKPLFLRSMKAC